MSKFLETERLALRPPERRDIATLAVLFADHDVSKMTVRIPFPYRRADAEGFLSQAAGVRASGGGEVFVVARKPDSYCLGTIGLERREGGLHLGYALGKFYWGQGYATEAAGALVRFAFETLNEPRILASYALDNPASGRVLTKLGFEPIGTEQVRSLARNATVICRVTELTREVYSQGRHGARERDKRAA